jgi:hypothetical protein
VTVVDEQGEGPGRGLEGQHQVQGQLQDLNIGVDGGAAEDVAVKLPELAVAASLGALVAPEVSDAKETQRLLGLAVKAGHHASHRGGHLRADGQVAPAPVGDNQQLFAAHIFARFGPVNVGQLEDGGHIFLKPKLAIDPPPGVKDVFPDGKFFRQPVAGAFGRGVR